MSILIRWNIRWRNLVGDILKELGGSSTISAIYLKVLEKSKDDKELDEKIQTIDFQAAVRRTLQNYPDYFEHKKDSIGNPIKGSWQLASYKSRKKQTVPKRISTTNRMHKEAELSWKQILIKVLNELNGSGSLSEIYRSVEELGEKNKEINRRVTETTYKSSIRCALQVHPDAFIQDIRGSGIWRLVSKKRGIDITSDNDTIKKIQKERITKEEQKIQLAKYKIRKSLKSQDGDIDEPLPISDYYKVVDYCTINKTSKWWSAVVLFTTGGQPKIALYLWQKKDEKWKRKHKYTINNKDEYYLIDKAINNFLKNFNP